MTVEDGGVLGGVGTIQSAVTVESGGDLAPGNSVGTLSMQGLSLSYGSILDWEFNDTANDLIDVSGHDGLTIAGGKFNLYREYTTEPFTKPGIYTLLQYVGDIQLQGQGLDALLVLNEQPNTNYVFFTAGNSVKLEITSVPEPGTIGLLLCGLVGLLAYAWRQRKRTGL